MLFIPPSGARSIAKACKDAGVDKLIHFSALNASPNPQRCLPPIGKYFKRFLPKSFPQSSASFLPNGSQFYKSKYAGELAVREEFPEAIIMRYVATGDRLGWRGDRLGWRGDG